jgi:hypothetical protein
LFSISYWKKKVKEKKIMKPAYTECFNIFNLYKALNYKYNGTKAESNIGMKSIKEELVEVKLVEVAAPVINSEHPLSSFMHSQ